MKTLFLLLSLLPALAFATGGPTKGRYPVPENHILVHEFLDAKGVYTEIFTAVASGDNRVGAKVVVRTNDGASGKDSASIYALDSSAQCEGTSGTIRQYIDGKAPTQHTWQRVVPKKWHDQRRRYDDAAAIDDVLATEICLQTNPKFADRLQAAWGEKTSEQIEEANARDVIREEANNKCKAIAEEISSMGQQIDSERDRLERRSLDIDEYRSSLAFRLQLLNAAPSNSSTAHVTNSLAAQWRTDQKNFNQRLRQLNADSTAFDRRVERKNARIDDFNDECAK